MCSPHIFEIVSWPFNHEIKGTLMQIWKSPYMSVLIYKQYSEKFAFLIQRILEFFIREVSKFPKK